jgi:hypothetical protein
MPIRAADLLERHGIALATTAPGRHYTICPKCSAERHPAHQKLKVLGVTIGNDGSVRWGCNHCAWTGPERQTHELQTYVYRNAAGKVLFRKVRNLPGREPKFWLERKNGDGWSKGLSKDIKSNVRLYRIDEVHRAIQFRNPSGIYPYRVIACVEGEKDVDNLWAMGIPATCNAHGASEPGKLAKWTKAHSKQLCGADIVVFNDNDAAGYAHAEAICKLSLGIAKRVRRLDLSKHWHDMPKGADVSDWLASRTEQASTERLLALIEAAPDFVPQPLPLNPRKSDMNEQVHTPPTPLQVASDYLPQKLEQQVASDYLPQKLEQQVASDYLPQKLEQQRQAYNAAMVAVQRAIPRIMRDAQNNDTRSKYARLETICKILTPIITENGFFLSFSTVDCPKPDHTRMVCDVGHIAGDSRRFQVDLPEDRLGVKGNPNKTAMHGFGSSMTYGRRYLQTMIFNIAIVGEDDDGNAATRQPEPLINEAEAQAIRRLVTKSNSDIAKFLVFMRIKQIEDMTQSQFKIAMTALNSKIAVQELAVKEGTAS